MMKVTKIVLYNNGIQSFERSTKVKGDAKIDLFFREEDMDEVLKTLVLSSEGSTGLQTCSYDSSEARQGVVSIDIPEEETLTSMLKSLKGNRVTLGVGASNITGVVLGVDSVVCSDGHARPHLNLLIHGTSLKSVKIAEISDINLVDEEVRKDVQHALEVYLSEKKKGMKKLTIFSKGKEDRVVLARYVLGGKEWQTNYRLALKGDKNAVLESYALIENIYDEDWDNVDLTLVAGAPKIRTASQERQVLASRGSLTLVIKTVTGDTFNIRADSGDLTETLMKKIQAEKGIPATNQRLIFAGKSMESGRSLADYNITHNATLHLLTKAGIAGGTASDSSTTFRMGDSKNLSYYHIREAVNVKRAQSALIPMLQTELVVQHVTLFNVDLNSGNPLVSVLFENPSGMTWMAGSLSISANNQFIGESEIRTMVHSDEALIPYALDLSVEVRVAQEATNLHVKRVEIDQGELKFYRDRIQRTLYTLLCNKEKNQRNFFLDHKFLDQWELVDTPQPVDITDRYYRFNFTAPAQEKYVFNVRERTVDVETVNLSSLYAQVDKIEKWVEKKFITGEIHKKLMDIVNCQKKADTNLIAVSFAEGEIREIKDAQTRLRKNLECLGNDPERKRYILELADAEDALTRKYNDCKVLREEERGLRKQANEYINAIKYNYIVPNDGIPPSSPMNMSEK